MCNIGGRSLSIHNSLAHPFTTYLCASRRLWMPSSILSTFNILQLVIGARIALLTRNPGLRSRMPTLQTIHNLSIIKTTSPRCDAKQSVCIAEWLTLRNVSNPIPIEAHIGRIANNSMGFHASKNSRCRICHQMSNV